MASVGCKHPTDPIGSIVYINDVLGLIVLFVTADHWSIPSIPLISTYIKISLDIYFHYSSQYLPTGVFTAACKIVGIQSTA
jgi:hypothetical protein